MAAEALMNLSQMIYLIQILQQNLVRSAPPQKISRQEVERGQRYKMGRRLERQKMDPWECLHRIRSYKLYRFADMFEPQRSIQREYYKSTLLDRLKTIRDSFLSTNLYLEERAHSITESLVSRSDIFGTGLITLLTKDTIEQKDIGKVIIIAVLDEHGQAEIEKYLHLFSDVFIINLMMSSQEAVRAMKVSPIRKKLKGFIELSLNFNPFIDSVYSVNLPKHERKVSFVEGLTSYLTSLPKFHQFQISFAKTEKNVAFAGLLEQTMNTKLGILGRHMSPQYKESSSPKIKILLVDRKIDTMSPLVYSYYFGPITKQLQILDNSSEFTTKSTLYNKLFSMDIQDASELLFKVSQEKADNKKQTINNMKIDQIKKAITMFCDQNFSPKEIEIQIDCLDSVKQFCKRRAMTCSLQQTIINNISEDDNKMSVSKIIDRIIEWASLPIEQFKPSQQDYIKMLILTYMVNDLWFFQRKIINAGLQGPRKDEIISYCRKVENSCKPLQQKQQGQDRFDLYRHKPAIIDQIDSWINAKKQFQQRSINKTSVNRQSRYVIAIDGPLGYNEACFILRYFKQRQQKLDVTIFCERLVNTKEYLKHLLPHNPNNH